LPIVWGTLFVAFGAMLVAIPLGLLVAIYLAEFAPDRVRKILKPILELLAGIPSVVFGYFALTAVTPVLQNFFPGVQIFNAASASIVVGFMILPIVASISDDSIRAVPRSFKDSGYAMGATKVEVIFAIVIPAALSGIVASFILAFARAIGETMAVTLAAGATPQLTLSPFESVQTITAYIVQVSLGDTPHGTVEYQSLFAAGMVLFVMVVGVNGVAHYVVRKMQRKYE
jgi:phosphate transport system permease protein